LSTWPSWARAAICNAPTVAGRLGVFDCAGVADGSAAAIIVLTLGLRIVLFPLTWKSIKATVGMRRLKPEVDALNEKFKDDARFLRHRGACTYDRENGAAGDQFTADGDLLLYEVYGLKGWPPQSGDEQNECMSATRRCWRNGEDHRVTPEESVAQREAQSA